MKVSLHEADRHDPVRMGSHRGMIIHHEKIPPACLPASVAY
jgi:hypothetical protein